MKKIIKTIGLISLGLTLNAVAAKAYTIDETILTVPAVGNPKIYTEVPKFNITLDDGIDTSFDLNWLIAKEDSGGPIDLIASSTWTLGAFDNIANTLMLSIDMRNDTILGDVANAAILSFGAAITPNVVGMYISNGGVGDTDAFDTVSDGNGPNQTFPGGFKNVDLCIFSHGCSGGNINTGLQAGDFDNDILVKLIFGDGFDGSFMMSHFPIKFQTAFGSFEAPAKPPMISSEPAMGLLLLTGLGMMAYGARRFKR